MSSARGSEAEARAARHLRALGYRVLSTNYRTRRGEIDLVALEGTTLCFIEIRYRKSARFGGAAASVSPAKQRRIIDTAEHYLARAWQGPPPPCRFDVLAIEGEDAGGRVTLYRDAFRSG